MRFADVERFGTFYIFRPTVTDWFVKCTKLTDKHWRNEETGEVSQTITSLAPVYGARARWWMKKGKAEQALSTNSRGIEYNRVQTRERAMRRYWVQDTIDEGKTWEDQWGFADEKTAIDVYWETISNPIWTNGGKRKWRVVEKITAILLSQVN